MSILGCKDDSTSCPAWSTGGYCYTNPDFMLANCQLSCKVCGMLFNIYYSHHSRWYIYYWNWYHSPHPSQQKISVTIDELKKHQREQAIYLGHSRRKKTSRFSQLYKMASCVICCAGSNLFSVPWWGYKRVWVVFIGWNSVFFPFSHKVYDPECFSQNSR